MDAVRHSDLSCLKLSVAARERVGPALPWLRSEPVAVVGLGCRFPGADGPEELAALLTSGVDAVREVPGDRWDSACYHDADQDAPGKTYTTHAGYLDDIASFDAASFGIGPAEALRMDPQQRLLLEVSRHALEHAAIAPQSLYGTPTGVFFGVSSGDYASVLRRTTPVEEIDGYTATGNSFSVAAGRVSYLLGLNGPSLAVDTACSSSLVSVHLAIQSLRLRECDLALAGGVNLLLEPEATVSFAKARMLAPDGRVKAFDARANGFVRGEGCGVLVLKRLSDAVAAEDDVWAVIRGSAVNQDGASSGLTAPNGTAQRALLRAALENAMVESRHVGFVEGHGTGTALGDPIELGALAEVYGSGRDPDRPLQIGSIKANIGHLESAAGVAGLTKAILALRRKQIPRQLHFETPSTHIDWMQAGLEVVREQRPFEPIEGRYIAAVSSFGFSGTNAHVILEAAPPNLDPKETRVAGPHAITLGAQDATRVVALAGTWADALEQAPDAEVPALVRTAWAGRDRGAERIAATGLDGRQLAENLRAAARETSRPGAARGRVRRGSEAGKLAFMFSGQGSAWVGMGLALRDREPVFREVLEQCATALGEKAILDPTCFDPDGVGVIDTGDAQPALFAFEVAMAELLRSRGLEPEYVVGHSVGELAAACFAGAIALEDAARLVKARADLMSALPAGGKMAVVVGDPARVERAVREATGQVSIAAFNSPRQVVVSGHAEAVDAFIASLQPEDARTLPVSHAFHSALMEPALDGLRDVAASFLFQPPRIPLVSSVTGALAGSEIGRPDYWVRQLREPVRFADAVDTLWTAGVKDFLEVGPGTSLSGLAREILAEDVRVLSVPTATRRRGELLALTDAVAALSVRRPDLDLAPWLGKGPRSSAAPRTSYQRRRIWPPTSGVEIAAPTAARASSEERLPVHAWGWTPSFRRLAPPQVATGLQGPVAVVGASRGDALAAALGRRSVPVVRSGLEEAVDLDLAGEGSPSLIVVFPPADGSTTWATALAEPLADARRETTLVILTSGAHDVTGAEELDPRSAADAAVGSVLGQEFARVRVRRIDLDAEAGGFPRSVVDDILADPAHARVVAYRGRHRWMLDYTPAPLRATAGACPAGAGRGDGIALIGRLADGLGERIASHLLRRGARRLIAICPGLGEDSCAAGSEEAEALARLRATAGDGDRVAGFAADLGDAHSLSTALDAAEAAHGPIDGIVHAGSSGRPEIAGLLVQRNRPAGAVLGRERIDGMAALAESIGTRTPRFVLVVTSLSAHVGGVGFADYSAANAYAEAFVARHARSTNTPWSTVAFEALREELGHGIDRLGEGSALRRLALSDEDIDQALDSLGLDPAGGADTPPPGALLIVPSNAAQRVERAHAPASAATEPDDAKPRSGGAAARDDVEHTLVEIWEEFLPTSPVGIHDDYFALGGTSLAAVQILSRVRARFCVDLPLAALLGKEPTIAAIAEAVRELQGADGAPASELPAASLNAGSQKETTESLPAAEDAEFEELLGMVEQLSPEEASEVLGERESAKRGTA